MTEMGQSVNFSAMFGKPGDPRFGMNGSGNGERDHFLRDRVQRSRFIEPLTSKVASWKTPGGGPGPPAKRALTARRPRGIARPGRPWRGFGRFPAG